MPETSRATEHRDIKRLLRYLRPYTALFALGVVLIAVMGIIDGLAVLAIKPAADVILAPGSTVQKLALFTIPGTSHVVYLNSFVPARVHWVWSVFALAFLFLFPGSLALTGNRQTPRIDADLQFVGFESGHLDLDHQGIVRFF